MFNSKLGKYKTLIEFTYGTDYVTSGSEMIYNCPYCKNYHEDYKLYINSVTGVYNCFRCGAKGKLQLDYDSQVLLEDSKSPVTSILEYLGSQQTFVSEISYSKIPSARLVDYPDSVAYSYIINRGISRDQMDYYDFRVFGTPELSKNRVVMPNRVISSNWTDFFTARALFSDMIPKYLNSNLSRKSAIVYNLFRIEEHSDIIINEGIFNSIIAGPSSVALLGKYCSKLQLSQILDKHPNSITISLDYDALDQSYCLAELFLKSGIRDIRIVHLPDGVDASDLGVDEYQRFLEKAEEYSSRSKFLGCLDQYLMEVN